MNAKAPREKVTRSSQIATVENEQVAISSLDDHDAKNRNSRRRACNLLTNRIINHMVRSCKKLRWVDGCAIIHSVIDLNLAIRENRSGIIAMLIAGPLFEIDRR